MESKESKIDTSADEQQKNELSRVEKKALARVWTPTKNKQSDFSTPKDGFMSTDITSLVVLAICVGVSLIMLALCASDDEYLCTYPATNTFIIYGIGHLTLIAKGAAHRRSIPILLLVTGLFGLLTLTAEYSKTIIIPANIPTAPDMGDCDWFTHTWGLDLYDCKMSDVPVHKLDAGPYNDDVQVTLTDLQIIYSTDATVTMGTSFDGGFYTGNNYTNKCSIAFHEAICGIYFPRCSDSCVPLKPCKHLCTEFEVECGDAGIIIYPYFETYIYADEWAMATSVATFDFYHEVTRTLVDCNSELVWEQDPDAKCDNRTLSDDWNEDDGVPVCTTEYRDNYLNELSNSHEEISKDICSPPSYVRIGSVAMFALIVIFMLIWDYVIGDIFDYGTIHENKWLTLGKMIASPTIPFSLGSYFVLWVTCTAIAIAVEYQGQHGYAMVSFLVPMFSWTMFTSFCRPEGQGDEDAIDLARPVPKWARRVAPYISILGSVMMLVGMVIALVIEDDVLATVASVLAVVFTFGSKSMQFYRADIYGLSGQDFWVSLFLMEIAEVAVQVVNISVVTASTRDRTVLLVATALLGSNLIVTPWLLVQDNVWFKTTAAVAFDCLLDLTIATFNAIAVVKVGSDDINTAGMLAIFYPIFMSALLLDSILHSYITWGGPLEAHRARIAIQEKMEQAKMRRRTKKYKEYEERLQSGKLSPVQRRRLSKRVSRRKSQMEKKYGDGNKDARRTTFKIWSDLTERLKVTSIGKGFLYLISLLGVVCTVAMFVVIFEQEKICKDEYGACLFDQSRPRIYFPDGIFNTPSCGTEKVTSVQAQSCEIETINNNVQDFINAESIDYSLNKITRIENDLFMPFVGVNNLKKLDLTGNPLTNIPVSVFKLAYEDDVEVDITNTQVKRLEAANGNITSLTKEDGSSPILEQTTMLEYLNISHNSIQVLPRDLLPDENGGKAGWTPNVVTIDVSHNDIEVVDTRFFELIDSVRNVNLYNNALRVAPTIMGAFASDGPTEWCQVGDAFRYHLPNIAPGSTCCTLINTALNSAFDSVKEHLDHEMNMSVVEPVCSESDLCANALDNFLQTIGFRGEFETGDCYNVYKPINYCGTNGTYIIDFDDEQSSTTLNLGGNAIAELLFVKKEMRVWFDISEMYSLKYVDYSFNRFEEQSIQVYDIRFPSSVISLSLKGNRNLRNGIVKVLESVNRDMTGLMSLEMQMVGAGPSCVDHIETLAQNQQFLRMLGISGNRFIGDDGIIRILDGFKNHYWIQNLKMQGINATEVAQIEMGNFIKDLKTPLLRFHTDYTMWTDAGCKAFADGLNVTNLYELEWFITTIDINFVLTDQCGIDLANAFGDTNLPVFYKFYCVSPFTDAVAYAWADAFRKNNKTRGVALFGHTGFYGMNATKEMLLAAAESEIVYAGGVWRGNPWTFNETGQNQTLYDQFFVDVATLVNCSECGLMLTKDQAPGMIAYEVSLSWEGRYCRPFGSSMA